MYLRTRVCLGLMLAVVVVSLVMSPLVGRSKARAESDDLWSRVKRVFAYDAPRRARYPSVARNQEGELVVLFTHLTEEQEAAGLGDIMMIRSADEGESWSDPTNIYQAETGEPRTMGSLTTLGSGKLVAALGEANLVRLLTSEDGGQSWEASAPLELPGVQSASPYGRLIEMPDGALLMPVFGVSAAEGQEGVPCVGLMRSTDGGQSWGDFSLIADNYTHPAVLATGEDSLVALVNSGESLYRSESEDGGYHWSSPEQVFIGREPQLVRITDQAIACVYAKGGGWGWILVSFSYDDGKSWRCDRKVMEHPGEPGGHFGWPAALALDAEHLLVAFGHTQLPSSSMDPPAPRPIAAEEERIEVVFFERDLQAPELPLAEQITPPAARDRWEYVEGRQLDDWPHCSYRTAGGELIGITGVQSTIWLSHRPDRVVWGAGGPEELLRSSDGGQTWQRQPMNLPPGFRGHPNTVTQLSSGRLLVAIHHWLLSEWNSANKKIIGQRGGYAIWDPSIEDFTRGQTYIIYSDDDGQTWQGTEQPIDISPFAWACPAGGQLIEQADGTIVFSVFGCLNDEDGRERLDSTGLFRSTDGGQSWGDFSQIAYDKEHRWTAYNEMEIARLSDQLWVAFMRTEYRGVGNESGWTSRAISTDGGYTWSPPELSTLGAAFGVEILPDGGIVLGHAGGIHFTYDLGRTWSRLGPAGGYAKPILLDDDTLLVGNCQSWGSFGVWRRIPAGPGGAE